MKTISNTRNRALGVVLGGALFAIGQSCFAQVLTSNAPTVTINATLPESIKITASPTATITLAPGAVSAPSTAISITTSWVLGSTRTAVSLIGWFTTPTSALSGGTPVSNIPSSEVLGQVTSGTPTAYAAFSQTAALGTASGGLLLFTQAIADANRASNRTDTLTLEVDLTSQTTLSAGLYTGTLNLQAESL